MKYLKILLQFYDFTIKIVTMKVVCGILKLLNHKHGSAGACRSFLTSARWSHFCSFPLLNCQTTGFFYRFHYYRYAIILFNSNSLLFMHYSVVQYAYFSLVYQYHIVGQIMANSLETSEGTMLCQPINLLRESLLTSNATQKRALQVSKTPI